jgi:hypothetical protein
MSFVRAVIIAILPMVVIPENWRPKTNSESGLLRLARGKNCKRVERDVGWSPNSQRSEFCMTGEMDSPCTQNANSLRRRRFSSAVCPSLSNSIKENRLLAGFSFIHSGFSIQHILPIRFGRVWSGFEWKPYLPNEVERLFVTDARLYVDCRPLHKFRLLHCYLCSAVNI